MQRMHTGTTRIAEICAKSSATLSKKTELTVGSTCTTVCARKRLNRVATNEHRDTSHCKYIVALASSVRLQTIEYQYTGLRMRVPEQRHCCCMCQRWSIGKRLR